jgi:hypothetical protein
VRFERTDTLGITNEIPLRVWNDERSPPCELRVKTKPRRSATNKCAGLFLSIAGLKSQCESGRLTYRKFSGRLDTASTLTFRTNCGVNVWFPGVLPLFLKVNS